MTIYAYHNLEWLSHLTYFCLLIPHVQQAHHFDDDFFWQLPWGESTVVDATLAAQFDPLAVLDSWPKEPDCRQQEA